MATIVLRPDNTTSETGWDSSTIHDIIGDNDTGTSTTQNQSTCNFTGRLENLTATLSSATINSVTISLTASPGRRGTATAVLSLVHPSDGAFIAETESYSSGTTTETTTARTTQQDGSSALTFAYINDCEVKIAPDGQGITAIELFVTVDYTQIPIIANIAKVMGVESVDIAKVNSIDATDIEKVIGI